MIAVLDPLLLILVTPLLLFPMLRPSWTAGALALLIVVWLLRWLLRREVWAVAPANLALLLFCLTIPVAVWASAVPELTLPKLTSLILGLAAVRTIGLSVRSPGTRLVALAVFAFLGLSVWSLGLLGSGFSFLQPIVQRLPSSLVDMIGGPDRTVNPNVLAGALLCYIPVTVVLAAYSWHIRRRIAAVVLALVDLLLFATLLKAQSRSAVVGAAVGLVLLALLFAWFRASRRGRKLLLISAGVLLVVGIASAGVLLARGLNTPGGGTVPGTSALLNKQLSLASRVEIWSRALFALQDFPFTGVGLGAFPRVLQLLYPLFLVSPDVEVGHAHNIFLQTGVDFGLGGLIAYIAMILSSAVGAWQVARRQRGFGHYLALGLLAALVGLHVYGLTDALDAKPAIVLWVVLGLIATLPDAPTRVDLPLNKSLPLLSSTAS